jgi:excisionase family DNA binding protein
MIRAISEIDCVSGSDAVKRVQVRSFFRPSGCTYVEPQEHDMATDELLTAVQAAAYLGIRPSTLRHWICDGKIEFVKYGNGLVRLKRSTLDRFVAGCTIKTKARHGRAKESRLLEGPSLEQREEPLAR